MKSLWKVLRVLMAFAGVFLVYAGASTSDYYIYELCQPEPDYIWKFINIGIVLIIPALVHAIRTGGVWE